MGIVSIRKIHNSIKETLEQSLKDIGGLDKYIKGNDKVILKPNINGTECVTNIEVIKSLIELLLDYNIKNITIAESTFGNAQITEMCFAKNGYNDLIKKYNIDIINLNKSEIINLDVKKHRILKRIQIAKEILNVDKIINIPVMKVHYATGITLALKNLKGILVGDEKKHFHEVGLDQAIVDLNNTIQPDLNIVDCTYCMEKMGPKGGDILKLDLLLSGTNTGEIDYIGSKIMGFKLDEIKHLKYFIDDNKIDTKGIKVIGEKIEDIKYNFKKAILKNNYNDKMIIHDINSCSACMNALLLSFQFLENEPNEKYSVFIGPKINNNVKNNFKKIAFGNCCIKNIDNVDYEIKGCPPYPFELNKKVNNELK
nr:conserved hypothetical protein, DUF362 family [uncultured archaeon]